MTKITYKRSRRDPDDQRYVLEEHKSFNGLLKLYKGNTENEWLVLYKIGIIVSKI